MTATLNALDTEAVVMAADMAGIDIDDDLRRDYSGRFMYGEKCFGLVAHPSAFARFMAEVAKDEAEGNATDGLCDRLAGALRTDDMGLSTIHYFPGLLLDGDA